MTLEADWVTMRPLWPARLHLVWLAIGLFACGPSNSDERVADNGAGGVCIMSRKGFYEVYGWEPSIGSWCPEDELMRSKVDKFDLKIGRSPYDMYHLDHDTKAHRRLARINDKKQWKEMVEKIAVFKQMCKQELIGHYAGIGKEHYR